MGMSAGQARLLSITSRLTNNEFRAQTITNSKLRLADKSQEASQAYMDALSSQKLMYGIYNDNGEYSQQALTPAIIYDYQSLKTQYAITNSAGKMLVSAKDAENYENSDTLQEFLGKYGLFNIETESYKQYLEDKKQYDNDYNNWLKDHDLDAWETQKAAYDRIQAAGGDAQKDLYRMFADVVGETTDTENPPKYCYDYALGGSAGCYLHVLNYLLDYDGDITLHNNNKYRPTIDTNGSLEFSINNDSGAMTNVMGSSSSTTPEMDANRATFKELSEALNQQMPAGKYAGEAVRICDGIEIGVTEGETRNLIEIAKASGATETELEIARLKSDYIEKSDGTYSLKSLKQKTIDMYYLVSNASTYGIDGTMMKEMLINFTEGDLKHLTVSDPGNKPTYLDPPAKPEFETSYNDKEKTQWYTNLWFMMNGSDTANVVKTITLSYNNSEEYVFTIEGDQEPKKSATGGKGNYEIFDDNLYTSADWLQFALEHGMVTLRKAEFFIPSENSGKASTLQGEGITWNSIPYTNASNITSVDDEVKIAIAEVKYKNTLKEIENKDKKYDQDLKKLETEHTALQTEYDSVKEVVSKNVERSFKAFS